MLSGLFIKIVGGVLIIVGLALILSAVGVPFLAASFLGPIWSVILGIVLIIIGAYLIKGQVPSL